MPIYTRSMAKGGDDGKAAPVTKSTSGRPPLSHVPSGKAASTCGSSSSSSKGRPKKPTAGGDTKDLGTLKEDVLTEEEEFYSSVPPSPAPSSVKGKKKQGTKKGEHQQRQQVQVPEVLPTPPGGGRALRPRDAENRAVVPSSFLKKPFLPGELRGLNPMMIASEARTRAKTILLHSSNTGSEKEIALGDARIQVHNDNLMKMLQEARQVRGTHQRKEDEKQRHREKAPPSFNGTGKPKKGARQKLESTSSDEKLSRPLRKLNLADETTKAIASGASDETSDEEVPKVQSKQLHVNKISTPPPAVAKPKGKSWSNRNQQKQEETEDKVGDISGDIFLELEEQPVSGSKTAKKSEQGKIKDTSAECKKTSASKRKRDDESVKDEDEDMDVCERGSTDIFDRGSKKSNPMEKKMDFDFIKAAERLETETDPPNKKRPIMMDEDMDTEPTSSSTAPKNKPVGGGGSSPLKTATSVNAVPTTLTSRPDETYTYAPDDTFVLKTHTTFSVPKDRTQPSDETCSFYPDDTYVSRPAPDMTFVVPKKHALPSLDVTYVKPTKPNADSAVILTFPDVKKQGYSNPTFQSHPLSQSLLMDIAEEEESPSSLPPKSVFSTKSKEDKPAKDKSSTSSSSSNSSFKTCSSSGGSTTNVKGKGKALTSSSTSQSKAYKDAKLENYKKKNEDAEKLKAAALKLKQEQQKKANEKWVQKVAKIKQDKEKEQAQKALVVKPMAAKPPPSKPMPASVAPATSHMGISASGISGIGKLLGNIKFPTFKPGVAKAKQQQQSQPLKPVAPLAGPHPVETKTHEQPSDWASSPSPHELSLLDGTFDAGNNYDITRYEDIEEDNKHRDNKKVPEWATDEETMAIQLFKQLDSRKTPGNNFPFPPIDSNYRLYPNI